MNTDVVMKANSHGIRIILNEDNSMEQILSDIREKLYSQEVFLKKAEECRLHLKGDCYPPEKRNRSYMN